jgi:TolB-like protein/Tfp pilus assembly protein PilF/tRNA A-37 threonylcarbamoyl transferase component Bud32
VTRPLAPPDWKQLEPLVDAILDAPPARRAELAAELSGGDEARRLQLERLVAECEQGHPLLDRSAAERFTRLLEDDVLVPPSLADRYPVSRELGRGGMAVVYLARDVKHGRDVAVKIVRPELAAAMGRDRFLREIAIAAQLHHPHIVPLYDSGEADGLLYYVMPYESEQSLRDRLARDGPLPVDEALGMLRDVCEALAYAHARGIVHRDVKPDNVLVSGRHAMVTDFGVAKAMSASTRDAAAMTTLGIVLGTPAYMAPEQITADPQVDHRADIYAVGALAFELLTGRPPFVGDTQSVLSAHLTQPPPPMTAMRPDVPPALSECIDKCLAKQRDDRWQSVDELRRCLEQVDTSTPSTDAESARTGGEPATAGVLGRRPRIGVRTLVAAGILALALGMGWMLRADRRESAARPQAPAAATATSPLPVIAVLPFENLGSAEQEYFTAGMTDEIASRLSAVSGLGVVASRATRRYAGTRRSMRDVGRELGIDYALVGSVRWSGPGSRRVRITMELLRAQDERQLWSTTYDRVIDDVFDVQSDIAGQIVQKLGVTLAAGERRRLSAAPAANHEAYTLYLKGRYYWNKRTERDAQIALDYFQQATDVDPGYSLAWVGIADTWISRGWYSRLAPRETFPQAKHAAMRALQFDSTLAEAHASLAHIHLEYDYDWVAAEREYRRAIALDSAYPVAHHWYGGFLSAMGRHEEAMQHARTAQRLDPLSPIIQTWVGLRHYFAGHHEQAIAEMRKAVEIAPNFAPAHWHLGMAYEQAGRYAEGVTEAERALALDSASLLYRASVGHAYARAGRVREARATLERLANASRTRHVSAYHVAVVHVALGDTTAAMEWVERAIAERSPWIGYLGVDPRFERLRSSPRFQAIVGRVGRAAGTARRDG